jgi:hypothetical protein
VVRAALLDYILTGHNRNSDRYADAAQRLQFAGERILNLYAVLDYILRADADGIGQL